MGRLWGPLRGVERPRVPGTGPSCRQDPLKPGWVDAVGEMKRSQGRRGRSGRAGKSTPARTSSRFASPSSKETRIVSIFTRTTSRFASKFEVHEQL